MTFPLSRGGANVPAEVQRWQYFLLKRGFPQVGAIDADFGAKTEMATRFFQTQQNLTVSGAVDQATLDVAAQLGYAIVPNNYYKMRNKPSWPPRPPGLESPSNTWRNGHFTCFKF